MLTFTKNDLVDIIYQGLHQRQAWWSKLMNYIKHNYISKENLKKIGKLINSEIKNPHTSLSTRTVETNFKRA
nr:DUF5410 family protein [Rickettsia canadensis]